ncbi:hypothetical protein V495_03464 [Pseudogymnoascus sp. VKM F-4514 (FW-929)]|nr:hypothetical protein V490_02988 [Pseudogymnoascus sp. VKM F-3557]KFY44427.1 hypothetical protein V495_03464 [Pseudogymnoascus sp. VKM F-4514 (FW-929)]KFY58499.1 hypothetical protein V497_04799 [Pseudogymnoascus sp. VKM F-4516 (FW-969)]
MNPAPRCWRSVSRQTPCLLRTGRVGIQHRLPQLALASRSQRRWETSSGLGDSNSAAEGTKQLHDPRRGPSKHGRRPRSEDDEAPQSLGSKMIEAAATAFASIVVLGAGFAFGGFCYHKFYKWHVLRKMRKAFEPGDPALVLAAMGKQIPEKSLTSEEEKEKSDNENHWIRREEQDKIDDIINGNEKGHYHLIIGEKGTGKTSMLLDAMQKIDGEGIAMFDAHADPEIFRIRLGKALNFEFHEDYIGSYFSEKGPRDSTALLDIERAFNKLDKVALDRRMKVGRPIVLIINSMHLLRPDTDGMNLLELLQQRAEQWAASNLITVVFNSDDYWVYERLKQLATRMEVTTVGDLPKDKALNAIRMYRSKYFFEDPDEATLSEVYEKIGGRLTFLNKVAKSADMIKTCDEISAVEKQWFLNQCGLLGMEMDDDVMDQQKYASAAMVLAQALVDQEANSEGPIYDPEHGHDLPSLPLHKARQVMTRADFIRDYDHINVFTITSKAIVRADSVPMQRAFREICAEPGFREYLDATLQRISDIESLGRTRELVAKDLVLGGKYVISQEKGGFGKVIQLVMPPEDDDDEDKDEGKGGKNDD